MSQYWIEFIKEKIPFNSPTYCFVSPTPLTTGWPGDKVIHVIEYSEYEKVKRELDARIAAEIWRKDKNGKLSEGP